MIRCSRQAAVAAVLVVLTTAAGGAAAQGAAAARTLAKPVAKAPPLRWWKPARYTNGTFTRFQYQLSDSGSIPAVPGVQARRPPASGYPHARWALQPLAWGEALPGVRGPCCP